MKKLKIEITEKMIHRVYENRYHKNTTIEESNKAYEEFCSRVDLSKINVL